MLCNSFLSSSRCSWPRSDQQRRRMNNRLHDDEKEEEFSFVGSEFYLLFPESIASNPEQSEKNPSSFGARRALFLYCGCFSRRITPRTRWNRRVMIERKRASPSSTRSIIYCSFGQQNWPAIRQSECCRFAANDSVGKNEELKANNSARKQN